MPRGVQQGALSNYGLAGQRSGQYNQAAQDISGQLVPQLTREATNPQGFSVGGLNALNTANMQSIGGATAGAEGQGNLEAARTRNPGGFTTALDEAARSGQRQLSQNALGTQVANEELRNQNQQAALRALQGLYGTDINASLGAFGLSNQALGIADQAGQGTFNNILNGIRTGANILGTPGPFAGLGR